MRLVSLVELSDDEKLRVLQRHDQYRQWRSLDEKRYCLVCGEIITGREVRVIKDKSGNGPRRVICPTDDCNARPMEWVCPTDDVLIKIAMIELECRRLRLITRAGRAMRSVLQNKARNPAINQTSPEPPFG
jgi:hypothetical protein